MPSQRSYVYQVAPSRNIANFLVNPDSQGTLNVTCWSEGDLSFLVPIPF